MKTIARLLLFMFLLAVMVKVLNKNNDQDINKVTIAQVKQ
ncbi:MAG: hypothetical protein ACI9NI_000155 [Olleya marilimosa]|jgi:hypothetical protein